MTPKSGGSKNVRGLGRIVPGPDGKIGELAVHRQMTEAEWDSAKKSVGYLIALNAPNALGKVEAAKTELLEISAAVLNDEKLNFDANYRIKWAQALEQWLTQYVSVRRRFVAAVAAVLGEGAGDAAEERFDKSYQSNPHYRLVWELRNLSEHGHNVLDLTTKHNGLDAQDRPTLEWNLSLQPVVDLLPGKIGQAVAGLWSGTAVVEMGNLIHDASSHLTHVMVSIWASQELTLSDAANAVLALIAEAATEPGAPILMDADFLANGNLEWNMQPLLASLATSVLGTLDEARAITSQHGSWEA